jgi:hypothetical protein
MKSKTRKILSILGFFMLMAFFAVGMNACGKKKDGSSGVRSGQYGYGYGPNGQPIYGAPGGSLGVGGGYAPDGSSIELSFSGQNGGQVYASGYLTITPHAYNSGCGIQPGTYALQTQQPGYFYKGNFDNITLIAQNGMPVVIRFGWFNNSYVTMPSGQQMSRIMAVVNIPGCPTNFN